MTTTTSELTDTMPDDETPPRVFDAACRTCGVELPYAPSAVANATSTTSSFTNVAAVASVARSMSASISMSDTKGD